MTNVIPLKILQILILCTQFFFNLDEQLWKLENTDDPDIVKLINKAHGDVQLILGQANQADDETINIKNTDTNMLLDPNGIEINEVALGSLTSKKWEKFPPNCAGYFRICTVQPEGQLLTASTSDNFVLEPPSRTAATISGKSVCTTVVFPNWYLNFDGLLIGLLCPVYVMS